MRGMFRALGIAVVLALVAPGAADAQVRKFGYIPLPDGAKLRYTVLLPDGEGPFPTLMQYEGYFAGSDPTRANKAFVPRMVQKGYAVVGVNLRGSGCSDGAWELFNEQQGKDGAFAVDWLAQQPWSNGKVAMYSYSYGGIMQLWVAAQRPKSLVAIAPGNVVADTYRDIAYPGGVTNVLFPPQWGASLNADWAIAAREALTQDGDAACAATVAGHPAAAAPNQLAVQQPLHPFDDQWHRDRSVVNVVDRINVPVLGMQSWQDEQTGPRSANYWDRLDPERTWLVTTNGHHSMYSVAPRMLDMLEAYYDHFLKGEANGFEKRPRVEIWHETSYEGPGPRSVTTRRRLPVRVQPAAVPLGPGGLQSTNATATSYQYPLPSPPVVDPGGLTGVQVPGANTFQTVPDPGVGRAQFTTPPLAKTITTWGPASADLWVSTTAKDVDLQATITEVRPDGGEEYVQRGWLRASHRAVDESKSTPLQPWHPHTKASIKDMPPGEPQLLRLEMLPFGHTFRAGSSLRLYVEMPSNTGIWGFLPVLDPQTVTVRHDASYPSRLMLGLLPDANVEPGLADCATVYFQPCRTNTTPVPGGSLTVAPLPAATPAPTVRKKRLKVKVVRRTSRRVVVRLRAVNGRYRRVRVELRRGGRRVVRSKAITVGAKSRKVVLRRRYTAGRYRLVVRSQGRVVTRRATHIRRSRSLAP